MQSSAAEEMGPLGKGGPQAGGRRMAKAAGGAAESHAARSPRAAASPAAAAGVYLLLSEFFLQLRFRVLASTDKDASAGDRPKPSVTAGQQLTGKVTRVMPYGVFVSLGDGNDGMLHANSMRDHTIDVMSNFKEGAEVTVRIPLFFVRFLLSQHVVGLWTFTPLVLAVAVCLTSWLTWTCCQP